MLSPTLEPARRLVLQHGWNSTAYQILNPGIQHWFNRARTAVVGHVTRANTLIAAGAPICDPANLQNVIAELEDHAAARDQKVCYFAAAAHLEHACRDSPNHSILAIGAQPVWDPRHWPDLPAHRPSLRAQLHRAKNKHVSIHPANPAAAANNPAILACLNDWLIHRHMPPLHFMVEPQTLAGVTTDRKLWIATQPSPAGEKTVAFLLASPVPARNGWLIEQIVRIPATPNGTVELLIHTAMQNFAAINSPYVTLGLVALSPHAAPAMQQNPWWFRALTAWARAHGRRFYNFDGLEAFRQKLAPHRWETIYAITNQPAPTPQSLYAIAAAFSANSPLHFAAETLAKAATQELHWLREKIRFFTSAPKSEKLAVRQCIGKRAHHYPSEAPSVYNKKSESPHGS